MSQSSATLDGELPHGLTELEELRAIAAISVLKARYFRYVDTQQWDALAELFSADATLFFPENQVEPTDLNTTLAFMAQALVGATTIHHGHMPEIEILAPDSARGIWAMEDRIYLPSNQTGILECEYSHGYGHYHEEYVRRDGQWLIRRLKLTRLWVRKIRPAQSFR